MRLSLIMIVSLVGAIDCLAASAADFRARFPATVERRWPGPEMWANPLPDWRVADGALVCDFPGGNRNVAVLTRELSSRRQPFSLRVTLDTQSETLEPRGGWVGFQVGLRGQFRDYRDSAVNGRGLCAGADFGGRLFIGQRSQSKAPMQSPLKGTVLELAGEPVGDGYRITLRALDSGGKEMGRVVQDDIHPSWLEGLAAITISTVPPGEMNLSAPRPEFDQIRPMAVRRGGKAQMAFRDFTLSGPKFEAHPERVFGPILWCQHSLQNNGTLKLMAQFPPLGRDRFTASLELDGNSAGTAEIEPRSSTALFVAGKLDTAREHPYAVLFKNEDGTESRFTGRIRPVPQGIREVTVAAFSCDCGVGFPHNDLVANVTAQKPDLMAFLGDQIYEGNGGYGVLYDAGERSVIDYLRKYFLFGWTWRELMRDIPMFAIPDDHDVFHGNLWGCGGRKADTSTGFGSAAQDTGGYKMPPEFVNVVHRTQAGNLPDPFDPAPCDQGISVYYTSWEFGPLDLAILADRQFKSAPRPLLPEADIFNGFVRNTNWNPRTQGFHPEAQLLGARQEKFLAYWGEHRPATAKFRVAFSQTLWNCMGTLPKGEERSDSIVPSLPIPKPGDYPDHDVPTIDFDTDAWPQAKRNLALRLLKQAGCLLHVAGDQHLGSSGRYGIEAWNDGPWWITTPAVANLWPRRWFPQQPGRNHTPGAPRYTGEYEDQFGNKMTVLTAANPRQTGRGLPLQISDRAPGYVIIHFRPATGDLTMAAWPDWASPARPAPDNQPYAGWPITVKP